MVTASVVNECRPIAFPAIFFDNWFWHYSYSHNMHSGPLSPVLTLCRLHHSLFYFSSSAPPVVLFFSFLSFDHSFLFILFVFFTSPPFLYIHSHSHSHFTLHTLIACLSSVVITRFSPSFIISSTRLTFPP